MYRWNSVSWDWEATLRPEVPAVAEGEESPVRVFGHSIEVRGYVVPVADSKYGVHYRNKGGVFVYKRNPTSGS